MEKTQQNAPNDNLKHVPEGGKDMKPPPAPKTGTIPGSQGNTNKPYKLNGK